MLQSSYTQGHDDDVLKSHRSRTAEVNADYLLPYIMPNHQILDVGCGPGTITTSFVKYVPEGRVVGIDISDKVLEQARTEAALQKIGGARLQFHTGSAHEMPFEDETFDIVHCHALLVHLPNTLAAVREMRRVCKKGGYVAAREPDWDTMVVHPLSEPIQRWKSIQAQLKRNEGAVSKMNRSQTTHWNR
jgi:ubiquinone/menaquinone biosynthesis C-methylase UbiE